jgi:hypothetical protein
MGEAIAKTGSPVLLDTHAQKTAQRLGVATDTIRREFAKFFGRGRNPPSAARERSTADSPPAPEPVPRPGNQEFWLLRLLLVAQGSLDWVAAHLDLEWIQHAGVRNILQRILAAHAAGSVDSATLVGQLTEDSERSLATEALAEGR